MEECAADLRFEEAEAYKQRYIALENFAAKSEIVSYTIADVDVFSIVMMTAGKMLLSTIYTLQMVL